MALMQITIIPVGTGSTSVGSYVADVEKFLTEKGVEHRLGDMGTLIEGDPATLFTLAGEIHDIPFTLGASRVVTHITIDDRRDLKRGLGEKTTSVYERLQKDKQS